LARRLPAADRGPEVRYDGWPFFSALRQAAIVASDDSRGIDFDFEKGTMLLTARNANLGESRIEMPIPFEGDKVGVTLDHKFVADFLKVLKPEQQFVLEIEECRRRGVVQHG